MTGEWRKQHNEELN